MNSDFLEKLKGSKLLTKYSNNKQPSWGELINDFEIHQVKLSDYEITPDMHSFLYKLCYLFYCLAHLIGEYFQYDVSHSSIYNMLKDVFEYNFYLDKIGAYTMSATNGNYNNTVFHSVFSFFDNIFNFEFASSEVSSRPPVYREEKMHVYKKMKAQNLHNIKNNHITFHEFASTYNINRIEGSDYQFSVSNKFDDNFNKTIEISPDVASSN